MIAVSTRVEANTTKLIRDSSTHSELISRAIVIRSVSDGYTGHDATLLGVGLRNARCFSYPARPIPGSVLSAPRVSKAPPLRIRSSTSRKNGLKLSIWG